MNNTTNTSVNTEKNAKLRETPFLVELSLRDYFAAKALIAIIGHGDIFTHEEHSDVARWAYGYSDAMLEERNK